MSTHYKTVQFHSVLAPLMNRFIQEKRSCGYKYEEAPQILKRFDGFLDQNMLKKMKLPRELVLQWIEKQPHEQISTHQRRICFIRQFAQFMVRMRYSAYVPPDHFGILRSKAFSPYIFTHKEIKKIFKAVDNIKPSAFSPTRHLIMPVLFRLLYGCGFRLNEVLTLRVRDVDLKQGVIIVREGKFGKDRLVPPSLDLVERLQDYTDQLEKNTVEKRTDD